MNQYVHLIEPPCNGFNIHLKVASYYDWIIENTADATYCQHPVWSGEWKKDENGEEVTTEGNREKETTERNEEEANTEGKEEEEGEEEEGEEEENKTEADIENEFPYDYDRDWNSGTGQNLYFLECGIYKIIWSYLYIKYIFDFC